MFFFFNCFTKDEELAEQVKLFTCLYNKSANSYKEGHVVRNAWAEVAWNLEPVKYSDEYFACLKT